MKVNALKRVKFSGAPLCEENFVADRHWSVKEEAILHVPAFAPPIRASRHQRSIRLHLHREESAFIMYEEIAFIMECMVAMLVSIRKKRIFLDV